LDAKDDLVIECYKRSFDTIIETQQAGENAGGDWWHKLSSVIATLLDVQFSVRGPLLRTTALTGLPRQVRSAMIDRSNRIARRYARRSRRGAVACTRDVGGGPGARRSRRPGGPTVYRTDRTSFRQRRAARLGLRGRFHVGR